MEIFFFEEGLFEKKNTWNMQHFVFLLCFSVRRIVAWSSGPRGAPEAAAWAPGHLPRRRSSSDSSSNSNSSNSNSSTDTWQSRGGELFCTCTHNRFLAMNNSTLCTMLFSSKLYISSSSTFQWNSAARFLSRFSFLRRIFFSLLLLHFPIKALH